MFDGIKTLYRGSVLSKLHSARRQRSIPSFDKIKSIGIIFNAADESAWSIINRYTKRQINSGCRVSFFGIKSQKNNVEYSMSDMFLTVCDESSDLNFWGIPKKVMLNNFTTTHFDLLIDVTGVPNFISQYVAMSADTGFNVSYNDKQFKDEDMPADSLPITDVFDFSIDGHGRLDISRFLQDLEAYLRMIKSSN